MSMKTITVQYSLDQARGKQKLSLKKCCQLDEAYDVDTKKCFKLGRDEIVFEPYDYFTDILSMVDVDYDYEDVEFPLEYNISGVGKPNCNENGSEEHFAFNIPEDPDPEEIEYRDQGSNDDFRIEFPSHELFELR